MNDIYKNGFRHVRFRYDILRDGFKKGEATVTYGKISYNAEASVKRTAMFDMLPSDVDFIKDRIRVYMIADNGEKVLGTFLLASPQKYASSASERYRVEAYDTCLILKEDSFTERTFFASGTRYDAVISNIIESAGVFTFAVPQIPFYLPADREFEIGTSKLEAINTLLDEVNYNPIAADEYGDFIITEYIEPSLRSVSVEYLDDECSVITSDYESEADAFGVPNVFIARCDNPELDEEYYSVFTNDNPGSKLSTVYRGRRVVSDVYMPDYIDSQQALDKYIRRKAAEESMIFNRIKVRTALSADHGYKNTVYIRNGNIDGVYIEKSWEMELSPGALMIHNLAGVVEL